MVKRLTQLQKLALRFGEGDEPIIEEDVPFEPESVALLDVNNFNCNERIADINKYIGLGHTEEMNQKLGQGGIFQPPNRYHNINYAKLIEVANSYITQLNICDINSPLYETLAKPLKEILEMLCYYNSTGTFGIPDPKSSSLKSNTMNDHAEHKAQWDALRSSEQAEIFKNKIRDILEGRAVILEDFPTGEYRVSLETLEKQYCQDSTECFNKANPPAAVPAPEAEQVVQPSMEPEVLPSVESPLQPSMEPEVQPPVESPLQPSMEPEVQLSMESPVLPSMEPEVQSPVEPVSQDLQVRVEALQRELEQANTANAATVEQLNQAAGVLNERITSLKQDKTALEQQLAQAQAGDPQVAELQQQIGETVAARATAEQQLAEVQGRYEAERQASLQQFEAIQATVTTFITRSRENLNGALARIESMNQLLDGGSAAAFGFVLAYGKRQNLVSNRNLYGRQYSTMPNMFGKNYQNELELYSSGSEYSDGYE